MSYYRKLIIETTGCTVEDARFVEDVMRTNNGRVLDHLPPAKFKREALKAAREVPAMRA